MFSPAIFSVRLKSMQITKYLFIKINANNEKYLDPNVCQTTQGNQMDVKVHKFRFRNACFYLKTPLGTQSSMDIIIFHLADFTLECKCSLQSLVSDHHTFKSHTWF